MTLEILGHQTVREYLSSLAAKDKIPHSLLFTGPDGIGKSLVALELAYNLMGKSSKILSGNHPDVHILRPQGKANLHSIDALRQLSQEVNMKPNESAWKIFIIVDAEKMLPTSANALLKTFEEPTLDTLIILLSSEPEKLLPTILSRCHQIRFQPLPYNDVVQILCKKWNKSIDDAQQIATLAHGSLGKALHYMQENTQTLRHKVIELLLQAEFSNYSKLQKSCAEIHELIDQELADYEKSLRKDHQLQDDEIESLSSAKFLSLADHVLTTILDWFRDLEIIHQGIDSRWILNQDFVASLQEQKPSHSLKKVYAAILQTRLALERSLKFSNCLENFFLSFSKAA